MSHSAAERYGKVWHSPQTVVVQQLNAGAQNHLGVVIVALGALIGQTVEQLGVRGAVALQPYARLCYGRLKAVPNA